MGTWKKKSVAIPKADIFSHSDYPRSISSTECTQQPVRHISLLQVLWNKATLYSCNVKTPMQYLCLHISASFLICCASCRQLHILSWVVPRQPTSFGEHLSVILWLIMDAEWGLARWLTEGLTVWGTLRWWRSFPRLSRRRVAIA